MKVEVIKRYVDRDTKDIMEIKTKHDYPDERADELISEGYVIAISEKRKDVIKK